MKQRVEDPPHRIVDSLLRTRRAVRSLLDRAVDENTVREILDSARWAPSNSNIQPWRVYVLAGSVKTELSGAIAAAHRDNPNDHVPCYKHFADSLGDVFASRQREFGRAYYGALNISIDDLPARHAQTGRNFDFFGAPVGLIFTIDRSLVHGSWLDYGMFLQSIMIAAKARDLDSCPQVSFAKYHAIITKQLRLPDDSLIVCGMSLGYADVQVQGVQIATHREPVSSFATFSGFE